MSLQYLVILCVLPKSWLIRRIMLSVYFLFIGIFVTVGGKKHKQKAEVIVSNHVSLHDGVVIEAVQPSNRLAAGSTPDIIRNLMGWGLHIETDASVPVSFFPEKETTNGKALLKFCKEDFEKYREKDIQPMLLMTNRPWFIPVNLHTLHSTFWSDLFWIMFIPYTHYHVSYMPVIRIRQIDEDVDKLQKDMAFVLNIESTNIMAEEKKEYTKRLVVEELAEERRRQQAYEQRQQGSQSPYVTHSTSNNHSIRSSVRQNSRYDRMSEQVKNVLPQVPMNIIQVDIAKTKNVDQTISNLLDGSIHYKPLNDDDQAREKEEIERIVQENSKKNRTNKFGETTELRHLSFQERKRKMISEARRKYLERHPQYI